MIGQIQRWKDLWQWLPTEGDGGLSSMSDTVPIGDFLTRVVVPIDKARFPLDGLNVIEKITFGGELKIRTPEKKRGYKGPLFRANTGDLLISKIRVAQGSLCIVPSALDHVAVSNEYPVYRPDDSMVNPGFLSLLLRSAQFQCALRSLRSGNTTKARLRPEDFEALPMPLPEPENQRRLVAAYQNAVAKAAKLEAQAQQIERDAQREFEAALGLTPPPNLPKRPFQIARFRDIERWSHEGILQDAINRTVRHESTFDQPTLGEVAQITHGCSHPPSAKPTGLEILRIRAVARGDFHPEERKSIRDTPELRARFDLREGDILMCRTNGTLAYVGMAALVLEDTPNLIFPDKVIRVRLTTPALLPDFLWTLLKSPYMRMKIEANARTAVGNYAIGSSDLAALEVIAPPLEVQKRIAGALRTARDSAAAKRKQAAALRAAAWNDFIAAVFA
ncbi:MAG: hypothetical protein FJ225_11435 [Lentisphaerae bacterium]|nr:hypothetical protein [Lentisphaerota bacterium]